METERSHFKDQVLSFNSLWDETVFSLQNASAMKAFTGTSISIFTKSERLFYASSFLFFFS